MTGAEILFIYIVITCFSITSFISISIMSTRSIIFNVSIIIRASGLCMTATIFKISWDSLMFYQILLSPEVKRCAIITYKHGIYESPHALPKYLRLRILGNYKILGNCLNFIEWQPSAQSSCQNENFVNTSKNLPENSNQTFPIVRFFTWKLELFSNILRLIVSEKFFLILTLPRPLQTFFDNFGNSKAFHTVLTWS